jgi:excisionase family DNA binding protein
LPLTGRWPHARDDCDECGARDADLRGTWRGAGGSQRWCLQCAARSLSDLAPLVGPVLVTTCDMPEPQLRPSAGGSSPAAKAVPPPAAQAQSSSGMLTVPEVAAQLRLDPQTVRRLILSGRLPAVRLVRQYRVKSEDLRAYLEQRRTVE